MNNEDINCFMNEFTPFIFEMISSTDPNERKGGIWAIIIFMSEDIPTRKDQTSRFANFLRNQMATDDELVELVAHAIGRVAKGH